MNETKNSYVKWLLTVCIMILALTASGCDYFDKKGERSNVVITDLFGGRYRDRHVYSGEELVQYGVWIGCVLKNNSNVSASITSDWKFVIDDNLTIDAGNARSYFDKVIMSPEIGPLQEAKIELQFFYDSWNRSDLSGTKFSKEFFAQWHEFSATITIEDDNGYTYSVNGNDKKDF